MNGINSLNWKHKLLEMSHTIHLNNIRKNYGKCFHLVRIHSIFIPLKQIIKITDIQMWETKAKKEEEYLVMFNYFNQVNKVACSVSIIGFRTNFIEFYHQCTKLTVNDKTWLRVFIVFFFGNISFKLLIKMFQNGIHLRKLNKYIYENYL